MGQANTDVFNMMKRLFGRNRGTVWRADREWFAFGDNPKQDLQEAAQAAKESREINPKGWTNGKSMMKVASVPMVVMLANPQLWHDKKERARFLVDHPEYTTRGKGLK
jgi:hypothetical protein